MAIRPVFDMINRRLAEVEDSIDTAREVLEEVQSLVQRIEDTLEMEGVIEKLPEIPLPQPLTIEDLAPDLVGINLPEGLDREELIRRFSKDFFGGSDDPSEA